jgi:multidrug efflux pump subunit AcrB
MTSLTTFFGLSPMIFETSVQARFLIPMALALGFGILLATPMLVLVVPSFYLVIEDVKKGLRAVGRKAGLARQPGSWTDAQ